MPNVRGLLSIWLENGRTPQLYWFLAAIVILGIVISGTVRRGNSRQSISLAFSCGIVLTLVTSYYAKTYDLITLVLLPLLMHGRMFFRVGFGQQGRSTPPASVFNRRGHSFVYSPDVDSYSGSENQFSWIAIVLFALAASLFWAQKPGLLLGSRRASA